jgi:Amt family ammonium transporter
MEQLGVQIIAVLIAIVYAAVVTLILLWILNKTMGLRPTPHNEMKGLDNAYHGERGYGMLNPN